MKTLITGIGSEVGLGLSQRLISAGNEVVGFDIQPVANGINGVTYVQGDVLDLCALSEAAKGCDAGIHLAVLAHPFNAAEIMNVNVTGAYNFMAVAREQRFRIAILAGSAPVHLDANANEDLMPTAEDEDHAYDLSKVLQEVVVRDFHAHGNPVMCLRFGHIVRGKLEQNLDSSTPLSELDYCRGGWVAIEDVVTACAVALELSPDLHSLEILNIVGAQGARKKYQIEQTERRLGIKLAYGFANYN